MTGSAFFFAIVFYVVKRTSDPVFSNNAFEISTYTLIGLVAFYIFINLNHLKLLYDTILGYVTFSTVYLGILLAGTKGLSNQSYEVIEGLTRITIAIFAVWKLSADMRHLNLKIDPYRTPRSNVSSMFYGILFPPKELFRLFKVLLFIVFAFYSVFTGLDLLSQSQVNLAFFAETERVGINILFFGIQTPMMMASRASVSKTFSEYLANLEWAEASFLGDSFSDSYQQILDSNSLSYDSINSNGKHLWLTVLLIIFLQAFQEQILSLDIFQIDYLSLLKSLWDVIF